MRKLQYGTRNPREAKAKLMAELSGIKQVALTTECWTSINNEGFMTLTVHYFLCEKLKVLSRVLNTIKIDERHTSVNLAKELRRIVAEWNLTNKISAVVTDNAANIKNVISKRKFQNVYIIRLFFFSGCS